MTHNESGAELAGFVTSCLPGVGVGLRSAEIQPGVQR